MENRKCRTCGKIIPINEYCCDRNLGMHPALEDNINHPKHYTGSKIEVIEFIEDKNLGFHLGNAVKYIARAGKKDPEKYEEDLEKAIWYIRRRIELKKENPRRPNDMTP
jgi:hypothetical protein